MISVGVSRDGISETVDSFEPRLGVGVIFFRLLLCTLLTRAAQYGFSLSNGAGYALQSVSFCNLEMLEGCYASRGLLCYLYL